jgi:hypothetical protein
VFASAHDLLRFAMAALGTPLPDQRAVVGPSSLDAMLTMTARSPVGYGYGVGWTGYDDEAGFVTRGHTGGMGGVTTVMTLVPSERIAVVALSNSSGVAPQRARVEVLSALLPAYAARRADAEALLAPSADATQVPVPTEVLSALSGVWEGEVSTYAGGVPLRLDVRATQGEIHARLGSQLRTLVNRLRWDGARLTGVMFGDLGTDDARRRPHHVVLDLCQRGGDVLDGSATAMTVAPDGEGAAPGRRAGNALSHVVRLTRS